MHYLNCSFPFPNICIIFRKSVGGKKHHSLIINVSKINFKIQESIIAIKKTKVKLYSLCSHNI